MEPKFVHFIKFNGYLIVTLVCYCSLLRTVEWLALLQSWYQYPSQLGWFRRDHPIVAGVLLLGWITVAAFLYQGLNLEVEAFVLPIGYLFALEVLIVVVQDVISTWNNEADERFLRDVQDVVMWAVAVVYFYYTLYIVRRLFRSRQREAAQFPAVTVTPEYSATRKPIYPLAVMQ